MEGIPEGTPYFDRPDWVYAQLQEIDADREAHADEWERSPALAEAHLFERFGDFFAACGALFRFWIRSHVQDKALIIELLHLKAKVLRGEATRTDVRRQMEILVAQKSWAKNAAMVKSCLGLEREKLEGMGIAPPPIPAHLQHVLDRVPDLTGGPMAPIPLPERFEGM